MERQPSTRSLPLAAALVAAALLHLVAGLFIVDAAVRTHVKVMPRTTLELISLPPPAKKPEPAPEPEREPEPSPDKRAAAPPPEPKPAATEPPPSSPPPPQMAASDDDAPSLMRLPTQPSSIDRVLGTGSGLAPSAHALEGALDLKADGPVSDNERARRKVQQFLAEDLNRDEIALGLTDNYFQLLREAVERAWRPGKADLNDGGESAKQLGMLRDAGNPVGWSEMWQAYLDLSKQYAQGQQPRLEPARKEHLRELMRSRNGAFKRSVICEVKLTQGPDGKVVTLDVFNPSGHPKIDEGVRNAFTEAIAALDPPPPRVSLGRTFDSTWRLRATWRMVPPTALLSGANFEITKKGFDMDVPFDIKLDTNVLLEHTSARPRPP